MVGPKLPTYDRRSDHFGQKLPKPYNVSQWKAEVPRRKSCFLQLFRFFSLLARKKKRNFRLPPRRSEFLKTPQNSPILEPNRTSSRSFPPEHYGPSSFSKWKHYPTIFWSFLVIFDEPHAQALKAKTRSLHQVDQNPGGRSAPWAIFAPFWSFLVKNWSFFDPFLAKNVTCKACPFLKTEISRKSGKSKNFRQKWHFKKCHFWKICRHIKCQNDKN